MTTEMPEEWFSWYDPLFWLCVPLILVALGAQYLWNRVKEAV